MGGHLYTTPSAECSTNHLQMQGTNGSRVPTALLYRIYAYLGLLGPIIAEVNVGIEWSPVDVHKKYSIVSTTQM